MSKRKTEKSLALSIAKDGTSDKDNNQTNDGIFENEEDCSAKPECLKQGLVNFDMLTILPFGVSSNLSQQQSPTAEIIGTCFLGAIVPRKYMPIIFAVELFCCEKFEETPNEKVSNCQR